MCVCVCVTGVDEVSSEIAGFVFLHSCTACLYVQVCVFLFGELLKCVCVCVLNTPRWSEPLCSV